MWVADGTDEKVIRLRNVTINPSNDGNIILVVIKDVESVIEKSLDAPCDAMFPRLFCPGIHFTSEPASADDNRVER